MASEDKHKNEDTQEDAGWKYKPTDGAAPAPDQHADEPAEIEPPKRKSVEWTASEFVTHEKGFGWYVMLALGASVVAAIIYLATKDMFAVAVVIIMVAILAISGSHKPKVVAYKADSSGITVGSKFYPYSEYKSFSMPQEGPFTTVVLIPMKHVAFPVGAYLAPDSQDQVLEIISSRLPLEHNEPGTLDRLMRHLRF